MATQITSIHSSYYEKLTEHMFLSDILQIAWFNGQHQIEISRSEIDNSGFDLILECNRVIRHIQLKSSAKKRSGCLAVNMKLEEKPAGCIILIIRNETSDNKFDLKYQFFGSKKDSKLPSLENYQFAKHSRGNKDGVKNIRPHIKNVPVKDFVPIGNRELLHVLFGI